MKTSNNWRVRYASVSRDFATKAEAIAFADKTATDDARAQFSADVVDLSLGLVVYSILSAKESAELGLHNAACARAGSQGREDFRSDTLNA